MQDYSARIEKDPRDIDAYYQRGLLYLEDESYRKVLNDGTAILENDKNNQQGYSLVCEANIGLKNELDSYESCKKAIELQTIHSRAYFYMANQYKKDRRYKLAIHNFEKAFLLNPTKVEFIYALAKMYEETNKPKSAKNMYKKVLELEGEHFDAKKAIVRLNKKISKK